MTDISVPFGAPARLLWRFAPDVTYLNHGAFGATPAEVLEAQSLWRDRIEAAPGGFIVHELARELRAAADRIGRAFGVPGAQLAFTDNATTAVNAVLRSCPLAPGDEVLITRHTYGAVKKAARFIVGQSGAVVTEAAVPFPLADDAQAVAAVERVITSRTRLAILDHIVSETAHVLPIAQLVAGCRAKGVPVLVDGAHAPGQVPLDIAAIGADWYTGNLHKWLFAPRGSAILWASPTAPFPIHPTVISWPLDQGFPAEFDWVGTRDFTPWLTAPTALAFFERLGPARVMAHNRDLALAAGRLLADAWKVAPVTGPERVGAMLLVPLPGRIPATEEAKRALEGALWRRHRIHAAFMLLEGRLWLRVSAQVYNTADDFARLAATVLSEAV
ncbi:MAG TPA: aminotransferase class V-fold PLP-dependent enzyme [Azospirillaceae bacterium]|nr:aminotransferase class V-fold PLP-dependent enzyme [Azospirillaceae bacterium]